MENLLIIMVGVSKGDEPRNLILYDKSSINKITNSLSNIGRALSHIEINVINVPEGNLEKKRIKVKTT